ncbi:MAG: hypothetical protein QNK05_25940 [Myxococcota bacterium]|nr:hypothetical protein [Myxococcota bacterium]
MRRGFGRRRRRRSDGGDGQGPIDPSWLEKVSEAGLASNLEAIEVDGVPSWLALVARGEVDGASALVSVSKSSACDALLAVVAAATAAGDDTPANFLAVAPTVEPAALSLRARVQGLPSSPRLAALEREGNGHAAPEPRLFAARRFAESIEPVDARATVRRALAGLEGLAAKHGGSLRGENDCVELVILGRRVAGLRLRGVTGVLELGEGRGDTLSIDAAGLVDALDRVEGLVRKRAGDRRVRDGEEGLRQRSLPALARAAGLTRELRWPSSSPGLDAVDVVGLGADGTAAIGLTRETLGLRELGLALAAADRLAPRIDGLLGEVDGPVSTAAPRVVLAGRELAVTVPRVAGHLGVAGDIQCFELQDGAGGVSLSPVDLAAPERPRLVLGPRVEPTPAAEPSEAAAEPEEDAAAETPDADASEEEQEARPARRRRSRGRRRGRGGSGAAAAADGAEESEEGAADEAGSDDGGFDEVSLFDLDLDSESEGESRGRGRRRRRGRRSRSDAEGDGGSDAASEAPGEEEEEGSAREGGRGRRGGRRRRGRKGSDRSAPASDADSGNDGDDEDDELILLAPDAPDPDEAPELAYDADDEAEGEESEADRVRLEREKRRLARLAGAGQVAPVPAEEEEKNSALPRGRVAILAHADRDSIGAAVLLAREWRQVEGIWVYPQEELMTFFRSVTPDLRDNSPILVVGFEAHPARDVIQAVSLYAGRLAWFDHHAWPPEDALAIEAAVGADHLHLDPGVGSSLPAVVSLSTRRSRFSDKLVDLLTGRFSTHDHQRWGRLWWWRLGEIAKQVGDQRQALEPLLGGRPSDLAKEARRADAPPVPEEIEYVRQRDFRLVHFGGLSLVTVDVPTNLDLHLVGRLVRERYAAALSLVRQEGSSVLVLGADDLSGRRTVDVASMVEHLALKFRWADALSDADHVARLRIHDLDTHPERLDDVVAEIGMGRSILEG